MNAEGSLTVDVAWDGERIVDATPRSRRPLQIARVLEGRTPDDACACVQRLFSICGQAQLAAARAACDAALERSDARGTLDAECRVIVECAREHAWRLLLDLPPLLGEVPGTSELAQLRSGSAGDGDWRAVADTLERTIERCLLGMPSWAWMENDADAWLAQGTTSIARSVRRLLAEPDWMNEAIALPWLTADMLRTGIAPGLEADAGYEIAPVWQGQPAETGAWPRQRMHRHLRGRAGHLARRAMARLIELVECPGRLRALSEGRRPAGSLRAVRLAPGRGIAAVETARGTLIHQVTMAGGKVSHWRIVAPTEWNFHPRGPCRLALEGMPAASESEAARLALLAAAMLDPCVGYHVEVRHA
jgi:coenzyme F420-reducing hydrogenase alpha subunit